MLPRSTLPAVPHAQRLSPRLHCPHGPKARPHLDRAADGEALELDLLERGQRAAAKRGGEDGTPGVADHGAAEVEQLELLQPPSRRRRRACSRRRRQEGGEAVVGYIAGQTGFRTS